MGRRRRRLPAEARAARLNRRIDDLLRIARSETGQLALDTEGVDLAELLSEVQGETAAELSNAGMELTLDVPDGLSVSADRNWLRQVIVGLVRNAIRHARAGGALQLAAREREGEAEIIVTDNGPGIPPEDQSRLFDRFTQGGGENAQGFGLGLALARWVIEAQGGTIAILSPLPRTEALGEAPIFICTGDEPFILVVGVCDEVPVLKLASSFNVGYCKAFVDCCLEGRPIKGQKTSSLC